MAKKEMTLRQWIEKYNKNDYNCSRKSMIEMGWYDWFCDDIQLFDRLQQLAPKVIAISESKKIDIDKTYVFFKNNCPFKGPTYDLFGICDIESGDVLCWVGKLRQGCYGENYSGWELTSHINDDNVRDMRGWNNIRKYFGI